MYRENKVPKRYNSINQGAEATFLCSDEPLKLDQTMESQAMIGEFVVFGTASFLLYGKMDES